LLGGAAAARENLKRGVKKGVELRVETCQEDVEKCECEYEEKGNKMTYKRVATFMHAYVAELLGIKVTCTYLLFCSYVGVGCANASLGTSTMHDPLRCLSEVVRHDSQ
jgi:hypothetical protein